MITEPSSPGRAGIVYSADRRAALWGNPKSNRGKSVERLYAILDRAEVSGSNPPTRIVACDLRVVLLNVHRICSACDRSHNRHWALDCSPTHKARVGRATVNLARRGQSARRLVSKHSISNGDFTVVRRV